MERTSRRGGTPSGWHLKPGDPGVIGVLSAGIRKRLTLPKSWEVQCLGSLATGPWPSAPPSLVLADPGSDQPQELALRLAYLARMARHPQPPVLLLPTKRPMQRDSLSRWLSLPRVRFLEPDRRPLARQVYEEGSCGLLEWVAGRLIDLYPDSPLLESMLRRMLLGPVPSEVEACEPSASGMSFPYHHTVEAVSSAGGWSPAYVRRHLPLAPSVLVRSCTLLRGIVLYSREVTPWTTVATRLGFGDLPAWTHFCRRLLGAPPREIAKHPRGHWISMLFGISVSKADPCQLSLFA